jgi:hypothetical protein
MRSSNEKDKVLYVLTIIGGGILWVTLGNGKISLKVSMAAIEQKEVVYFSLLIRRSSCRSADFAVNLHEERAVDPDKAKWFMSEGSLPSFL